MGPQVPLTLWKEWTVCLWGFGVLFVNMQFMPYWERGHNDQSATCDFAPLLYLGWITKDCQLQICDILYTK